MNGANVKRFKPGTAEYIVMHARWKRSRGKSPSATFLWERNPRKALAWAMKYSYFPKSGAYLSGNIPDDYNCSKCGVTKCKLWRSYRQAPATLLCAHCAAESQGKDINSIDSQGLRKCKSGEIIDQIGFYIPAVPKENSTGYWNYFLVPDPAVQWWRDLPTLPQPTES